MSDIPIAASDRIIRNAPGNAGLRVGTDAAAELSAVLEEYGADISEEAGKYARHAGRKTVKASDIVLATK
ncbi:MAG: histone [Candidatus Hydrothermarchaeaceae archaeon]